MSELGQASVLADLSAALEAERGNWSQPVLEWQIHSELFAHLLKSRDKASMLQLARDGQTVERPMDFIKHPYVLDLPEAPQLHEFATGSAAIIEKLQPFLLALGKGFSFVARQHRVSTESQLSPAHRTHCHLDDFALSWRFRRPATGMPEELIDGSFLTLKKALEYLKVNELSVY